MTDDNFFEFSTGCDLRGSVSFLTKEGEVLRLDPDGKVYVRGNLAGDDIQVYEAFRQWLVDARCVGCGGSILERAACAG